MKLILIPHWRRTSFEITYIAFFVSNQKGTFKLTCITCIYPEICGKLHGASYTLWYITERSVAEYCRIKRGKEIISVRDHRSHISFYKFWILPYCLAERTEYYTKLGQGFPEGGLNGYAVHNGIHCNTRQMLLLLKRDAQPVESPLKFRIDVIETRR